MKPTVSPHMVALLILGTIAPLSAQNLVSTTRSQEIGIKAAQPGSFEVPAIEKAQGELPAANPVYAAQDSLNLEMQASSRRSVESVVDLDVLRSPSPYRKVASGTQPYEIEADSLQNGLARISAVYRAAGKSASSSDCPAISLSVEQRIQLDVSKLLEIVEAEIGANPACACEIVKMAIKASDADVAKVVSIVETAIIAAPDSMRIISQCAIASLPESIAAVQALLAELDPNSGDAAADSSKSAKSGKESAKDAKGQVASIVAPPIPNPLDLPPFPPFVPPIIIPPTVSDVDPG